MHGRCTLIIFLPLCAAEKEASNAAEKAERKMQLKEKV
jgi:hypothetical protein